MTDERNVSGEQAQGIKDLVANSRGIGAQNHL